MWLGKCMSGRVGLCGWVFFGGGELDTNAFCLLSHCVGLCGCVFAFLVMGYVL